MSKRTHVTFPGAILLLVFCSLVGAQLSVHIQGPSAPPMEMPEITREEIQTATAQAMADMKRNEALEVELVSWHSLVTLHEPPLLEETLTDVGIIELLYVSCLHTIILISCYRGMTETF